MLPVLREGCSLVKSVEGASRVCVRALCTAVEPTVVSEAVGSARVATLNRPKALNALDLPMIRQLADHVKQWNDDKDANVVVMKGAGDKAFCAGGDIVTLYKSRGTDSQVQFFREEYEVDYALATMGPTQVALYDGIVMGGGVGVSIHAPFRVATEKTLFAMPEVGIGFFPDVGGSHFLSRLEGCTGMYLALSGARVKGADAVSAGIATHFVPSADLAELTADLTTVSTRDREEVALVLSRYAQEVDSSPWEESHRRFFDNTFVSSNPLEIVDAVNELACVGNPWAMKTLKTLASASPTSLHVVARQMVEGGDRSLADCLIMELTMAQRFMQGQDFYEGVRGVLIERDVPPRWENATDGESDYERLIEALSVPVNVSRYFTASEPSEADYIEPLRL